MAPEDNPADDVQPTEADWDAYISERDGPEDPDTCDDCGGTGYDHDAPDDGTEDYDVCKTCGGLG